MMGKVNLYAPFAGVKDALGLLALLDDKKKLKEVLGVIKTLNERIDEINTAIEVYAKVGQIDALRAEETRLRDEAKRALTEAEAEALRIQADAQTAVDQLVEERKEIDAAAAEVARKSNAVGARERALETDKARLVKAVKAADDAKEAAENTKAEAAQVKAEYESTLARIAEVAGAAA